MDNFNFGALAGYLPNLLVAVLILVVGWLVALLVSRLVGNLLGRTNLDNRIAGLTNRDPDQPDQRIPVERWVSTAVFWIIMLFAIVAFLQTLNLAAVSAPLNSLLGQILAFIPALLSAAALIFVAWLLATVLRLVVVKLINASGISRKLSDNAQVRAPDRMSLGDTVGNIVYWLVFLLFLPAILGALNLQGILAPVQTMVNEILGTLPNILAAALILVVGWLAARIVRQIVTGLLAGVGVDRIGERAGIPPENRVRLSNVLGTLAYVLILIPVGIAALNALNIPAISDPASAMLTSLLNALPVIFGAIVLIGLAYFAARLLRDFIVSILTNLGFDGLFASMGLGTRKNEGIPSTGTAASGWSPARIVGTLVMVAVLLFAAMEAANMLGFEILASVLGDFIVAAGNILIGLIILTVGMYLSALADNAIRGSRAQQAGTLATLARAAILVFTGAIALRQMGLGEDIVNLAFGLLLGAVAVAAALAFGLGGREAASRQIEKWRNDVREGKIDAGPATIPSTGSAPVSDPTGESRVDDTTRWAESGASEIDPGMNPGTGQIRRGDNPTGDQPIIPSTGAGEDLPDDLPYPPTGSVRNGPILPTIGTEDMGDLDDDMQGGVAYRPRDPNNPMDFDSGSIPNTGMEDLDDHPNHGAPFPRQDTGLSADDADTGIPTTGMEDVGELDDDYNNDAEYNDRKRDDLFDEPRDPDENDLPRI